MSWWSQALSSVRKALGQEARDVGDAWKDLEADLDADLSRRERYLEADAAGRMDMIGDDIASSDDTFSQLRDKIAGASSRADADAEVAGLDADDDE